MVVAATQPTPGSYTCQINEHQRGILVQALMSSLGDLRLKARLESLPSDNGESSAFEDLAVLATLLDMLPALESESPGVIHGLCL